MDDYAEQVLRRVCCTCLSIDRKLSQLCKLDDGINNLFFLLSSDPEAYEAMFSRDTTLLFICWECMASMRRQQTFREQVCLAQKQLSQIVDGQIILQPQNNLSKLTLAHKNSYDKEFIQNDADLSVVNFIDCGLDIKCEPESSIHLIETQNDSANESGEELTTDVTDEIKVLEHRIEIKPLLIKKKRKLKKENINKAGSIKRRVNTEEELIKEEGYTRIQMSEKEMIDSIEARKLQENYVNSISKCESCVEGFKEKSELEEHNSRLHVQKPKYIQCDICLVYIRFWWLPEHRSGHYLKYQCHSCQLVCCSLLYMILHLRSAHSIRTFAPALLKKLRRKAVLTNPVLASKRNELTDGVPSGDAPVHTGFKCPDCNKYFENRYLRYKHILKVHREGHKCATCGKTFAFRNTLNMHEQIHGEPPAQEQCPVCGKMVRGDRARLHARIHGDRKAFQCVACDKRFVSRDSYEKHLKYSRSHAVRDVHKYKCSMCDKGFRTMRELNDHVNYNHMGKTQYKCPICHKALATRRCVTRHVSRAHHGIKEKSGDKILCQTCGKAFRDKKCLREHEFIHTGEKPLSCDECGRTFRQSAGLYTHKRRVHKMAPKRLRVRHDAQENKTEIN